MIKKREAKLDSDEEKYIEWWLEELKEKNLVLEIIRQPNGFILSEAATINYTEALKTKCKEKSRNILQPHAYTPDFKVLWNWSILKNYDDLVDLLESINNPKPMFFAHTNSNSGVYSYIEVKPIFDQNNMTREFKINQKWVWEKYKIYINLSIPTVLFENTFSPQRYIEDQIYKRDYRKKGKLIARKGDSKIKHKVITINQYMRKFEGRNLKLF